MAKSAAGHRPGQMDGVATGCAERVGARRHHDPTLPCNHLSVADDDLGPDGLQVRDNDQVRISSGSDAADQMIDGKVLGDVQGGHLNGRDRIETIFDGPLHHGFHVAVFEQIDGGDAIGDQGQAAQIDPHVADLGDGFQIAADIAFARHDMHAEAQALQCFGGGYGFMAGGDPGGGIGGQFAAPGAGGMAFQGFSGRQGGPHGRQQQLRRLQHPLPVNSPMPRISRRARSCSRSCASMPVWALLMDTMGGAVA
jgi:hypothetical protein